MLYLDESVLTLKPSSVISNSLHFVVLFGIFESKKIKFDFSCESSVRQQAVHLKYYTLFLKKKDMTKYAVCSSRGWCFKGERNSSKSRGN